MTELLDPPTQSTSGSAIDPIDALLPRPRSWWVRLLAGVAVVAGVGMAGFIWGQGYLSARPDCCGSGSATSMMALSTDGDAVTMTAYFFNSSGRELIVNSATADLPGAEVLDVQAMPEGPNFEFPVPNALDLPVRLGGTDHRRFLVTFVPTDCTDRSAPWGTISLDLDVVNGWLPSIGSTYDVDILQQTNDLSVLPPAWITIERPGPLGAACDLLGR